jgi:parvulin-like peptidyl-prolyl isomerase
VTVRSPLAIAVAVGAVLALAACTNTSDDAARVGETTLSRSEFEDVLDGMQEVQGGEDTDQADASMARDLLTRWIVTQVLAADLEERGIEVTDADRQAVDDTLTASNGATWTDAPESVRTFFLDSFAVGQAFANAAAPDDAELEASYDEGIAASGVACVRHILVDTEEEGNDVVARLEAGEDFAEVAAEVSTDPGSGANGGILTNQAGEECMSVQEFASTFIQEFVAGAEGAEVGVPTQPVQSQFGWHVILVRPFDEVADPVRAAAGSAVAQDQQADLLLDVDAWVASQYGKWAPSLQSVVPVDTDVPTTLTPTDSAP